MHYHINEILLYEKLKENSVCPLCELEKPVEEQILQEFLNDAVMDDDVRREVNEKGFCGQHYDMLLKRQNKLSVALQISTRFHTLRANLSTPKSPKSAKKLAEKLDGKPTCVICDYLKSAMEQYYKAIALNYKNNPVMRDIIDNGKGFCMHHYAELLRFSANAGGYTKQYLSAISKSQQNSFADIQNDLNRFCVKHDYRNAFMPLGSAENVLPTIRVKLYGKKHD